MLDADGYRPNVGMIVLNHKNQVWWGKRAYQNSWQFPQGGINDGESIEEAMFRELSEEVGLSKEHVEIIARTREWLHYDVPHEFRRQAHVNPDSANFKGQKQIWYLLRFIGNEANFNLNNNHKPEFDAWRWFEYWAPLQQVVKFKKMVYEQALSELECYLSPREERTKTHQDSRMASNLLPPEMQRRTRVNFYLRRNRR